MKVKIYSVKVRVSIPGFRNMFYQGLAFAKSPDQAKQLSLEHLLLGIQKSNPTNLNLTSENLTVTMCEKVKDDFLVNDKILKSCQKD
ncbi:MAG: hypothetical protein ACO1NU_08625 [Arcticibacter sp.]